MLAGMNMVYAVWSCIKMMVLMLASDAQRDVVRVTREQETVYTPAS